MFVISVAALLIGLCFACCCNKRTCSHTYWRKKRSDQRLENEVLELTRRLEENRKEMENRRGSKMEEGMVSKEESGETSSVAEVDGDEHSKMFLVKMAVPFPDK